MEKNLKTCTCCGKSYATGKDYGNGWWEFPSPRVGGLCQFCNPNNKTWFVKELKCHAVLKEEIKKQNNG